MDYQSLFFPFDTPGVIVFTVARIVLGILFFFQAYDKIFRIGLHNAFMEVANGTADKGIPRSFSKISVYASSVFELIGGLLLIAGLFTPIVLILFGVHLILVVAGFSYLDGIWDMKHVFPRLALLFFLILLPIAWNVISLDYLVGW